MPTTSILYELHHETRGSAPPVLVIAGASGNAGHFNPMLRRPPATTPPTFAIGQGIANAEWRHCR